MESSSRVVLKSKQSKHKREIKKIVIHSFIIILGIVMLYPLFWMVSSSFKQPSDIFNSVSFFFRQNGQWIITHRLERCVWIYIWIIFFGNTLLIVVLAIIGNVMACSMAAYAFAKLKFKFKSILFALMLMTLMLPFHVTVIPQYIVFNHLDWINTYYPLVLPKFFAVEGFFVFLMVQFIRGIPNELVQAAEIDGCGKIKTYWYLILPLSIPALVTTMIFTFIWTWNDFFGQLLYISDIKLYTVALGLRMFLDSAGESAWGPMFAMSTLSLIPLFGVFIFFFRSI